MPPGWVIESWTTAMVAVVGIVIAAVVLVHQYRQRRRGGPARAWLPAGALVLLSISSVVAFVLPAADLVWYAMFPLLIATYPNGRLVPRWFLAPVLVAVVVAVVAVASGGALTSYPWWTFFVLGQLLLTGGQIYRYRAPGTSTRDREAIRWGLLGVIITVEWFGLLMIVEGGTVAEHGPYSVAAADLGVLWYVAGLGIGLVRPRIWNVDRALQAVLGFTVAAPMLALGYALVSWLVVELGGTQSLAGWLGAAVVAATTVPIIELAVRASAFLVYRGRADVSRAVRKVGGAVAAEPVAASVPQTVVETLVDSLFLSGAELRGPGERRTQVGTMTPPMERFAVSYLGAQIAEFVVPPRPGESELTERDREIIRAIALHAAPALHGSQTLADLTDAHARLLQAREEERRRLRRDLHDDLSPSLVGLSMGAAAIARRIEPYDQQLADTAHELQRDIAAVVAQAREISHGLRPAILDEHGLAAAIRDRVGDPDDTLRIEVVAPPEPLRLPAAVDVAALRIVQEAVANVRRHASARRCTVELQLSPNQLSVRVSDDGVGLPTPIRPGVGIVSIQERARELGGRVEFDRGPMGGSRVAVALPFDGEQAR